MKTSFSFFKQFGTVQVKTPFVELEFIGARKEKLPERTKENQLVEDGSLEDDQNRRDFTINSLYWELPQ